MALNALLWDLQHTLYRSANTRSLKYHYIPGPPDCIITVSLSSQLSPIPDAINHAADVT